MVFVSRRNFVLPVALAPALSTAFAQGASFIGEWEGNVEGAGAIRLIITGIQRSGQIEGQMEFAGEPLVSTFDDKPNAAHGVSNDVVSGSALTIEPASGGTLRLTLSSGQLAGTYARGTTVNGRASLKRKF